MLKRVNLIILFLILIIFFTCSCSFGKNTFDAKKYFDLYKQKYLTKDGRIKDYRINNATTSEAQGYMLLQSAFLGDKKTFDLVLNWTQNNLERSDKLFSWLWGEDKNKKWRILDDNSATDADTEIAYALILAYEKWGDMRYLEQALKIIHSIWDYETKKIGDKIIITSGALQTLDKNQYFNPSYFSVYMFKAFKKYDNSHDWENVINSSYYFLEKSMQATETGLPPNWFKIKDNQIVVNDSQKSDFSYDAIRVFSRAYLDYMKTGDKRALEILKKSKFFITKWKENKKLYTNYKANGELRDKNEFSGSIAILYIAIKLFNQKTAQEIYNEKILPYLVEMQNSKTNDNYYADNLVWFALFFKKMGAKI